MDRLWREMDLSACRRPASAASTATSSSSSTDAQTTQQMIDRYYQHVDSSLRLQRATDERIVAVQRMAEGTVTDELQQKAAVK